MAGTGADPEDGVKGQKCHPAATNSQQQEEREGKDSGADLHQDGVMYLQGCETQIFGILPWGS